MNRTIKDATVKRFHYTTHDQLRTHLADFVAAYNFARRLKTLRGLTPYEAICRAWAEEPQRFTLNPLHQMPGLNNLARAFHGCYIGACLQALEGCGKRLRERLPDHIRVDRAQVPLDAVQKLQVREPMRGTSRS
jgi:hypothetical protein